MWLSVFPQYLQKIKYHSDLTSAGDLSGTWEKKFLNKYMPASLKTVTALGSLEISLKIQSQKMHFFLSAFVLGFFVCSVGFFNY